MIRLFRRRPEKPPETMGDDEPGPPRPFARARIREIPYAVQGFIAFTLANADRVFAFEVTAAETPHWQMWAHIVVIFSPFIIARITPVLAITPRLFLRDEAELTLDARGLFYRYDAVKRPLFVPWTDLERIHKRRWGLTFETRDGADLTEGMPKFQGEFWRGKIKKPIRLQYVDPFEPERALRLALAAARRAGVSVEGFGAASEGAAPARVRRAD